MARLHADLVFLCGENVKDEELSGFARDIWKPNLGSIEVLGVRRLDRGRATATVRFDSLTIIERLFNQGMADVVSNMAPDQVVDLTMKAYFK